MALLVKSDLATHLYEEVIDEITREEDSIVSKAIANGEGEVRSYLNRYDLTTMFGGSYDNQHLKSIVIDVVAWHLIKLANPNVNMELFRTSYEDAIKFLEKVMKGMADPEWPLKPDNPDTSIDESGNVAWHSNLKRNNHF